jgi:hypothetical protein
VIKVTDIGFVRETTQIQDADLSFSFSIVDADGDATATQTLDVHIEGDTTLNGGDGITGNLQAVYPAEGQQNDIVGTAASDDTLIGTQGTDNFVFDPNFGRDTLVDFTPGVDNIDFNQTVFETFEHIMDAAMQVGGDTVIAVDQTNSVTLMNVDMATLTVNDFLFHL